MGRKAKIKDEKLVQMELRGVSRAEQARTFRVSEAAITKAHQRIRGQAVTEVVNNPPAARRLILGLENLGMVAAETELVNRGLLFQAGKFDDQGNPLKMSRKERAEVLEINKARTDWLKKTSSLVELLFLSQEFEKFKKAIWTVVEEAGVDKHWFGSRLAELCETGLPEGAKVGAQQG